MVKSLKAISYRGNYKKKTFFNKLVLAASSIGLLASMGGFAADIIPVGNPSSNIGTMNDWRYNHNHYLPQDNDNIIIAENNYRVNFAQNININDINIYGFNGVLTVIEGNPTTRVSINNITNVDNPQTQRAVQNALGAPLAYGANNNAKAKLKLTSGNGTGSELTITGNDISAVESIELVFKEKVDMKHRNGGVIDTGNLEFISFGKVRVNKDFTGNITTTKTMRGELTFVKTPDIYEIGSQTKQVSKVTFEGNHEHKLHNDIHSRQTNFDSGTYNIRTQDITINGNANINGSTFDLRRNVILTGDVVLKGNITINALGDSGIVFQNLPTAFGTNIVININRGSHGECCSRPINFEDE